MKFVKRAGYVHVVGATAAQLSEINDKLSVTDPDFYHMVNVGSWDGKHRFFDWGEQRFCAGLGSEFGLSFRGPELEPVPVSYPFDFYPHQTRGPAELLKRATGVITAPTGSGKTVIIAEIVRQAGKQTWLLLYRQLQVARQTQAFLEACLGEPVGFVGEGEKTFGRVTVMLEQTGGGRFSKSHAGRGLFALTDGVIVDECHLAGSARIQKLLTKLASNKCQYFYGMSATYPPEKLMNSWRVGQFLGRKPAVVITQEEVDATINPPETYVIEVHVPYGGPSNVTYQEEVNHAVHRNSAWNATVARAAHELAARHVPCLVATENRVTHAVELEKSLRMEGVRLKHLNGSVKPVDRVEILAEVQRGDIDCVLATTVVEYGVDAPELQAFIDAGTWSSGTSRRQRLGRTRRPKEEERNVSVYIALVPDGSPRLERTSVAAVEAIMRENPNYKKLTVFGETGVIGAVRQVFG